jgi:glycosyltransferase involved in cell wall biosynthesis
VARAPVTILMGVFNGAAHLREQLDSFAAQDHADWRLVASDDGSADGSRAVIAEFAAGRAPGQVVLCDGPGQGHAANYLALLRGLPDEPGYLAFSDQDDVWLPDRLSRGIAALQGEAGPALFCSRSFITSDRLQGRRLSAARPRPPSFRNALVQNIAAGNTMLLNPAAARMLAAAARNCPGFVVHDWWAYLLVTGAGGAVLHDDRPTVLYRQHGANAIGANDGAWARLRRLGQVADGTFRTWNDINAAALIAAWPWLSPEAGQVFADWQAMRACPRPGERLRRLRALRLYRQTVASTAALWLAAVIGRL